MTSSTDATTVPAPAAVPTTPAAEDACDACPHPLSAHDAISLRFCRATVAIASSRACVCRP
jgi:hypothetical protein